MSRSEIQVARTAPSHDATQRLRLLPGPGKSRGSRQKSTRTLIHSCRRAASGQLSSGGKFSEICKQLSADFSSFARLGASQKGMPVARVSSPAMHMPETVSVSDTIAVPRTCRPHSVRESAPTYRSDTRRRHHRVPRQSGRWSSVLGVLISVNCRRCRSEWTASSRRASPSRTSCS